MAEVRMPREIWAHNLPGADDLGSWGTKETPSSIKYIRIDLVTEMKKALERAYGTMKDLPDFFEEGSHEHKALTVEADAIRAVLAKAEGEGQ